MEALEVVAVLVAIHPHIAALKLVEYQPTETFKQITRKRHLRFERTLKRQLLHRGTRAIYRTLARKAVSSERLRSLVNQLQGNSTLGAASRVVLRDNSTAHIPMLDFQCARSPDNLQRLRFAMRRLSPNGGVILQSVHSYHFYGSSLLSENMWSDFVGRCLLLEPLVDVRYLGHCLIDGQSTLRISPKRGRSPIVVAVV